VKVNPLWAEGRRHERDAIGSEGRTPMRMRLSLREGRQRAFDEKLDRSGLFRITSSNGLAQGGMRFKRMLLLIFMHIVSGVFSGCNSHTIASSMKADVQRFSPRLSVRVTSRLLGELCKVWNSSGSRLLYFLFELQPECPMLQSQLLFAENNTIHVRICSLSPSLHHVFVRDECTYLTFGGEWG
jgi:hypothetical protein